MLLVSGVMHIKTLTFVPFITPDSEIYNLNDQPLVTLKQYRKLLKWVVPKISEINSISELKKNQVIILPWNSFTKKLHYLPMNNKYFFESKEGTIQLKAFRRKSDSYDEFLKNKVVLTAGGTVVLARGVHLAMSRHQDIHHPWKGTRHLFESSDINIVNFKSPLIENFEYPKSSWLLVGKSEYAKGLSKSKIHLVGIAGNHMGDAKQSGFKETLKILDYYNIRHVGAGLEMKSAYHCEVLKRKGTQFGFLAFNNVPGSISKATETSPGVAWLDNNALSAIRKCDSKVDVLIVMVNWGIEYTHIPRKIEQKWAARMVLNGADLIIGDQAHWVQNHELINGAHVSYGLGNYIFDQHWSEKTKEGIIQKFVFYNNKIFLKKTIPIKLAQDGGINEIKRNTEEFHNILNIYNKKLTSRKTEENNNDFN